MRGQLSQGLVMKLSDLGIDENMSVGADVTEILGVKEYEIPERASSGGTIKGKLPNGVPKTDETRVQSEPKLLDEFDGKPYYITTKMDGTSCSIEIDANKEFRVTGHSFEYKDDGKSSFYNFIKSKGVEDKLRKYIEDNNITTPISVQGEFCAPGIQKNRLKLLKPEWYIFTVNVNNQRLDFESTTNLADAIGCVTVPLEETGNNLCDKYKTIDDLLERAKGEYPNGGNKEGIVIRPITPIMSLILNNWLSMKIINNEYLR